MSCGSWKKSVPSSFIKIIKDLKANDTILTGRLTQYLMASNGNLVLSDDVADIMHGLMTDGGNHDRSGRFGSSTRGDCYRAQVFAYLGMPGTKHRQDPVQNNLFLDGTWRHLRWQATLLMAGLITEAEFKYTMAKYRLGGALDAVNEDEDWIFELKGWYAIPSEPPLKHLLQVHTYMLGSGIKTCVYIGEHKQSQDWKEWVIKWDPTIGRQVKDELNALNEAVEERELPKAYDQAKHGKKEPCNDCPYQERCWDQKDRWPTDSTWHVDR